MPEEERAHRGGALKCTKRKYHDELAAKMALAQVQARRTAANVDDSMIEKRYYLHDEIDADHHRPCYQYHLTKLSKEEFDARLEASRSDA